MADNNENRSIFDTIETAASVAGVAGIAAAVLNGKGSSIFGSGLNRSANAFAKSLDKIKRAGKNFNYNTLKSAVSTFKDEFDSFDDSLSFIGLRDGVGELYSDLVGARRHAKALAQDTVIKNAVIGLQKRFSNGVSEELANHRSIAINTFMRRGLRDVAPGTVDSYRELQKLSDRTIGVSGLKFSDDDVQFINDELKHLSDFFHNTDNDYEYEGVLDEVKNMFGNHNQNNFMKNMIENIETDLKNRLTNVTDAERKFGSVSSPTQKQGLLNSILGDRGATIKEIRDYFYNSDATGSYTRAQREQIQEFIGVMDELISSNNKWSDIIFSDDVRIDADGNIRKFTALENALSKANEVFNETIVAKVLKTKEIFGNKQRLLSYSTSGTVNPFIEKAVEGTDTVLSNNAYISIYDKLYRLGDNGLEYLKGFDGAFKAVDKSGVAADSIKRMYGTDYQTYETRTVLDFYKSYKLNPFESAKAFVGKFSDPRYGRNVANFVLSDNSERISSVARDVVAGQGVDDAFDLFDQYSGFVSILEKSDNTLDHITASKLSDVYKARNDDNAKVLSNLFDILSMEDDDMIEAFNAFSTDTLSDHSRLRQQVSYLQRNPRDFLSRKRTESLYTGSSDNVVKFSAADILRKTATEEAMRIMNAEGEDTAVNILSSFGGKESRKALRSYYASNITSAFSDIIDVNDIENISDSDLAVSAVRASDVLNRYLSRNTLAKETLRDLVNDNISLLQTGFNDNTYFASQHTDNTYVKKGVSVFDIIRDLNDKEKTKSNAKSFASQFIAGTHNTEDVTSSTFGPYFFVNRLTKGFDRLGLGFSPDAYSSTLNLSKNIMLKRVLPVAGAIVGLSYLNFESDKLTGSSLSESLLSGVANIDLGLRKVTDTIGLTDNLKAASVYNPILNYWMNEEEYQSYDERKEWYEDGYTPIRSGRFWSFGSSSEFRGSKISYFAPNYLRRASSNYYDISVYGSSEEKWKHSWIPTPRYPLSTLNALLNPYWVEEMHYEDRPYPVTGKLFDEGTPWGVVLNPTVGELLKPQRRMHEYELQGTTVDVRALIRKYNEQEKSKAEQYYVSIGARDGISMVSPIPGAYPASGGGSGNIPYDYNVYYNGSDTAYYTGTTGENQYITNNIGGYRVGDLNTADKIQIASGRNPLAFAATKILPLDIISRINEDTKNRSEYNVRGGYDANNFYPAYSYSYSDARQYDPTSENFNKDTFLDTRSIEEWLTDASYSMKELGGIYGFAFDFIFPPTQKYADAHAGAMTSFSSRFWDESIGGFGGDVMEIARRFFPHEDHSVTKINNLRNTMPSWLPEKFQYSDSYTSLPKGDMRLPGPGYETLNELHPDQFGNYGALDRMKILADIAPWSQEYKQWRDIAKETVTNPALREEMEEIEERVERQSAKHTFYNRNYDIDTQKISGIVETVNERTFTLVGSDKTYQLAGIDLEAQKLSDFLSAGSDIQLVVDKDDMAKDKLSAIAYVDGAHDNLSKQLLTEGIGEYTRDTPIDVQAHTNGFSLAQYITEQIAHAPIPYIHNKFMRINTPMESWEEEELYGTSYSTWNHPIEGFIFPAFRKTMAMDNLAVAANVVAFGLSKYFEDNDVSDIINSAVDNMSDMFDISDLDQYVSAGSKTNKAFRIGAKAVQALTNPLSFAGATTAGILNRKWISVGADIGEMIGLGAIAYQNIDNPFISTASGAIIGATYGAKFFESTSKYGALVGGAIGLGLSALKNPGFNLDHFTSDTYIPDSVEKRWEMQEYFDRLRYIKYTGLYHKAAAEAKAKEGIDIAAIIENMEEVRKENDELRRELIESQNAVIENGFLNSQEKNRLLYNIQDRINQIYESEQNVVLQGGEYTQAALAYKQAADSTMYGLDEDASWSEILRALPKNHRDYFIEFSKVTDPKERREIRRKVSDYENRILDILWKEDVREVESNASFFENHYLPSTFWSGWKPSVSLEDVEIKTIQNEGMMLADFGYYDSNANEYETQMAPSIENYDSVNSAASMRASLFSTLNGMGLFNVDVSLTPTMQPGIQMFTDITRITSYKAKEAVNNFFGARVVY